MSIGSRRTEPVLARWGRLVYRARRRVLILSALSLVAAAGAIYAGGQLDPPDVPTETESGRALQLIAEELPAQPPSFSLIFSSPTLSATDPEFQGEVHRALAPLARDPRVARVRTAYDGLPGAVSRDGRRVLAAVELQGRATGFASLEFSGLSTGLYPALRGLVQSPTLEVLAGGTSPSTMTSPSWHDRTSDGWSSTSCPWWRCYSCSSSARWWRRSCPSRWAGSPWLGRSRACSCSRDWCRCRSMRPTS